MNEGGNGGMQVSGKLRITGGEGARAHTVLFSEVTLDKNWHQIWAHGGHGEGLDHMWSEYEQIPISPFWEKFFSKTAVLL